MSYERPSYAVQEMESQLAYIRGQHRTRSAADLLKDWQGRQREELRCMRDRYDLGDKGGVSGEFWYAEGWRTLTDAAEREYHLARFKEALADCAYVRRGHSVSRDSWHVYKSDPSSPTSVMHAVSFEFCPEADLLVEESHKAALPPVRLGEHR